MGGRVGACMSVGMSPVFFCRDMPHGRTRLCGVFAPLIAQAIPGLVHDVDDSGPISSSRIRGCMVEQCLVACTSQMRKGIALLSKPHSKHVPTRTSTQLVL